LHDFALRREVRELFAQLDGLRDGVIQRLEICHGLPHLMTVVDRPATTG
jgi:hypothetical protein